jgi:hypothetical protein
MEVKDEINVSRYPTSMYTEIDRLIETVRLDEADRPCPGPLLQRCQIVDMRTTEKSGVPVS